MLPNIVFITSHDLGKHLNLYGVASVHSPNIDALAADGIAFDQHFCTAPQCSPSRATLHTGRYAHANGMLGLGHEPFNWRLHDDEVHFARRLKNAGYRTALVGIQHLTDSPFMLQNLSELGYDEAHPALPAPEMAEQAVALLREMHAGDAPFYLEIGFFEAHREYDWGGSTPDDTKGVTLPPYIPDDETSRAEFAQLQGMIRRLDVGVGQVVGALKDMGIYEETLLVFTADHGIAMPRAKCTLYDPGIEVSLVMHGAFEALNGGRRIEAMTSHVDVVPTLITAMGLPPQDNLHGHDLWQFLNGQTNAPPREVVYAEKTYHTAYEPMRAIRTSRYKLIVNFAEDVAVNIPADIQNSPIYPQMIPQTSRQRPDYELYDLAQDPDETRNLAGQTETAEVERALFAQLNQWMHDTDDPLLHGVPPSPHHQRMMRRLNNG
jgi:N-sulfoglucosamine sulfohydrolase